MSQKVTGGSWNFATTWSHLRDDRVCLQEQEGKPLPLLLSQKTLGYGLFDHLG